jgi:hypothetical protein
MGYPVLLVQRTLLSHLHHKVRRISSSLGLYEVNHTMAGMADIDLSGKCLFFSQKFNFRPQLKLNCTLDMYL